ncbi:MAG TPA: glycosyltransferase, partial [Pirellulales bacterium]
MHRILHIIPSLSPSGTAAQLSLLAAGLARDEFELHVAVLDESPHGDNHISLPGVETTTIVPRRRFLIDPLALWRLHRHIRHLRPALVHTWLFDANTYGRLAAKNTGARHLIVTERHLDLDKSNQAIALDRRLAL